MKKLIEPFSTSLDPLSSRLHPVGNVIKRYLSDMRHMYFDSKAEAEILESETDRLIYEVLIVDLPEEEGQVLHCTTIIYPGHIGDEYHMTKGHFHAKRDRGELYLGLAGEGYVLLQTDDGQVRNVRMQPGAVVYVPPWWAHRTVNTGNGSLTFLSVWPGDAGHDYGTIEKSGFARLLVKRKGKPVFVDNPKYHQLSMTA